MQMLTKRIEAGRLGPERAGWMTRTGLYFLIVCFGVAVQGQARTNPDPAASLWDNTRYIDVDDVKPGMPAYCLTCYSGTTVERFDLDVISVIHDMAPGQDVILVKGIDERFIKTGPVQGCSGSPVFIEGRLAGALALGWSLSKEALYGVTPIREMLGIGEKPSMSVDSAPPEVVSAYSRRDYSKPLDFSVKPYLNVQPSSPSRGMALPMPLIMSGFSDRAVNSLKSTFRPLGLIPVKSLSGSGDAAVARPSGFERGGTMMVPLVSGDVRMAVLGTVTEVLGDKVYGFGHSFLGVGDVNFPLATGQVHTVVNVMSSSFKLGSPLDILGALTADRPTGVAGHVGRTAPTIPMSLRIKHFDGSAPLHIKCRLAYSKIMMMQLVQGVISGSMDSMGVLPQEHTIRYSLDLGLEGGKRIAFSNVSSDFGVQEVLSEVLSSVSMLLTNPYKEIPVTSIDVSMTLEPRNITARLIDAELSDDRVKAGDVVEVDLVAETYLGPKTTYAFKVKVPDNAQPGPYNLIVCGGNAYVQYLRRVSPYRLLAMDTKTLIKALELLLGIRRDRLYCILELPPSGLAVETTEFPDLPASKALVLRSPKRTVQILPYIPRQEIVINTDTIVVNQYNAKITVVK
ncbi:MAG: hypothetical protein GY809_13170 [Planctomycetes bacterium]|nr:hypothetical protein [Planctomycetota bacterium]